MLSFVNTRQQFIDSRNSMGIDPRITSILAKVKDYTQHSVSVLTDTISLIIKCGNGLLPIVEIHCNPTGYTLAKTTVRYWESECDLLTVGYKLLEECYLDDDTLHEAQETLNMLMSDCSSCDCSLCNCSSCNCE